MSSKFFARPPNTYTGEAGLANRTKYSDDSTASPRRTISSTKVDGDINYLIDAVNTLYDTAVTSTIPDGSISNVKIRAGAAYSVIGRSANTSGTVADIVAASNNDVLRRSGTTIGFGTITGSSLNMSTARLLGRTTGGSGIAEEISVAGLALAGTVLSGGIDNGGYRSGGYYYGLFMDGNSTLAGASAVTANQLYVTPFLVTRTTTFDRILIETTTPATGNVRMGIYNNSAGRPSSLLLDAGAIAIATNSVLQITISQSLTPGLYWLACLFDATPTVRVNGNTSTPLINHYLGSVSAANVTTQAIYGGYVAQTYGALPTTPFGGGINQLLGGQTPTMMLRAL